MKFRLLAIVCILMCAFAAYGQSGLVTMTGSHTQDAGGNLISNALLCAQVTVAGSPTSVRVGSGGQVITKPACTAVSNGAFSMTLPDTSMTKPANACLSITITDQLSGNVEISDACVQPSSSTSDPTAQSWCSTTTSGPTSCNFDNWSPNLAPQVAVQTGPQGAVGPMGCTLGGTCSSTLSPTAVYSTLYVNPASTTDLITQINSLWASCNHACTVNVPAGNYVVTTGTALMQYAAESLVMDGRGLVHITYSGTGPFLSQHLLPNEFNGNYYQTNEVSGFTVTCTNPAVTACMSVGDILSAKWHDITVFGPGGPNDGATSAGDGIEFQNTNHWMERAEFSGPITVAGFANNLHWMAPAGGTDSFAYGHWSFSMNVGTGTRGVVIDGGANVYNTRSFELNVNASSQSGPSDSVFLINGGFTGTQFIMDGEGPVGGGFQWCINNGLFLFQGAVDTFSGSGCSGTGTFNLGPGGTSTPVLNTMSSVGSIANFAHSQNANAPVATTQTVQVFPYVNLSGPLNYAPGSIAGINFVQSTTVDPFGYRPTSIMFTHDSQLPLCIAEMTGNSTGQPQSNGVCLQSFNNGQIQTQFYTATGVDQLPLPNTASVDYNAGARLIGYGADAATPGAALMAVATANGTATDYVVLDGVHRLLTSTVQVSAPAISTGSTVVYRCTTAGTSPVGTLTTVAANCGASVATNLTVN